MSYQVFNPVDEQGRLMRLPMYHVCKPGQKPGQWDSHGYSIVMLRRMYQELDRQIGNEQPFGLESIIDTSIK